MNDLTLAALRSTISLLRRAEANEASKQEMRAMADYLDDLVEALRLEDYFGDAPQPVASSGVAAQK